MVYNDSLNKSLMEGLQQYKYTEYYQGNFYNVDYLSIVATPRRFTSRYICSVTSLPQDVRNLDQASVFFEQIRKSLKNEYAKFPYFKEIGTYSIVLCTDDMYKTVSEHLEMFVDNNGMHMNVMLGTIFINTNTYDCMSKSTWGLYYSGKHFQTMIDIVLSWCEDQKN